MAKIYEGKLLRDTVDPATNSFCTALYRLLTYWLAKVPFSLSTIGCEKQK